MDGCIFKLTNETDKDFMDFMLSGNIGLDEININAKYQYWVGEIEKYCQIKNTCLIGIEELNLAFKLNGIIPESLMDNFKRMFQQQLLIHLKSFNNFFEIRKETYFQKVFRVLVNSIDYNKDIFIMKKLLEQFSNDVHQKLTKLLNVDETIISLQDIMNINYKSEFIKILSIYDESSKLAIIIQLCQSKKLIFTDKYDSKLLFKLNTTFTLPQSSIFSDIDYTVYRINKHLNYLEVNKIHVEAEILSLKTQIINKKREKFPISILKMYFKHYQMHLNNLQYNLALIYKLNDQKIQLQLCHDNKQLIELQRTINKCLSFEIQSQDIDDINESIDQYNNMKDTAHEINDRFLEIQNQNINESDLEEELNKLVSEDLDKINTNLLKLNLKVDDHKNVNSKTPAVQIVESENHKNEPLNAN